MRRRTADGVQRQSLRHVKPMHDTFVEPSSTHCSLIMSGEQRDEDVLAQVLTALEARLHAVWSTSAG